MTRPLIKKPGQPGGFVPIPYPNAIDLAASRFAEIRERHGERAIGLVGDDPPQTAIAVETQVLLVAGSTLGGMVRLLVESGEIDVELVADSVAGIPETALRRVGDARELVRLIAAGELNGLVSVSFDPPATRGLAGALDMLEFHLAMDTVLGRVARRADLVLPLTSARVRAQDRARSTAGIS